MKIKIGIITFICVFLLFGCENGEKGVKNDKNLTEISKYQNIVEYGLNSDLNGKQISLNLLGGGELLITKRQNGIDIKDNKKANLFVFFATWCPPCSAEIPHLNNLTEKFKNELNIIGVLLEDKSEDEISKFIEKQNIKYKIALGKSNFEFEKFVGGVLGLPFLILYKPNGDFAIKYLGLTPEEMIENDIVKAIN